MVCPVCSSSNFTWSDAARQEMLGRVNEHFASEAAWLVGKAWLVFSMFGAGTEDDLLLEPVCVDARVQLERLRATFGLELLGRPVM